MMSRSEGMSPLPSNFTPGPSHVICAKGKQAKEHTANQWLRSLIQAHLKEYSESPTKLERSFIVSRIFKLIQEKGGFVRRVNGSWYDIGARNAREKIGSTFRDILYTQYRSSSRAKASTRRTRTYHQAKTPTTAVSPSPVPSFFPISDVGVQPKLSTVTPEVRRAMLGREFDLRDLEPLPLARAPMVNVDFNMSRGSVVSQDSSFDEVMDEMYQGQLFSF